ncbi:jg13671 [Pararge aegeria aegeria]|uniref:Jg13671 protein n=1 Tax=Pararge aegeria aegeria TaxID=348720 RepID=A0A8S4SJR6_9NEOP|nr:jg13671 [Pararge aegeria aegeria]
MDENETKTKEIRIDFDEETEDSNLMPKPRKSFGVSNSIFGPLRFGSVLQTWTDISRINYVSALSFSDFKKGAFN